jgi:ATP-binding cassette subfamily B (MDR/TAP) protein 6
MPQLIDILVACTYLASALKGPWVALIVLFTVGSYVPLTLLITEQRGKVRPCCNCIDCVRHAMCSSCRSWIRCCGEHESS